jgi:hypothetical protein
MTNLLLGKRVEAHMYINRIPLDTVPEGDEAAAQWLHNIYQIKVFLFLFFSLTKILKLQTSVQLIFISIKILLIGSNGRKLHSIWRLFCNKWCA